MKISVIITVFNGEKYLRKAIDSFLSQQYDEKELIIVDGKSTDGSHEIIADYKTRFPHLIKWINQPDTGISNGRNIALQNATGDIVGFLGADDFLHEDLGMRSCDTEDNSYLSGYVAGKIMEAILENKNKTNKQ